MHTVPLHTIKGTVPAHHLQQLLGIYAQLFTNKAQIQRRNIKISQRRRMSTLYGKTGHHRTTKIQIAAELCGMELNFVEADMKLTKSKDFVGKNPFQKLPVLETAEGCLHQSNAILRFVGASLLGKSAREQALVDQFLDMLHFELETPANSYVLAIQGCQPLTPAQMAHVNMDLNRVLAVLDAHLSKNTYLVGDALTVADILLAQLLLPFFRFVFTKEQRDKKVGLTKHFLLVSALDAFKNHNGVAYLCKEEIKPMIKEEAKKEAPKKEAPKKEAPKKEAPKVEEPPKPKGNPLDELPASKFNLFDFKTFFVNAPCKKEAMQQFWKDFDAEGYSLWKINYEKYEGEGEKVYMTNNLLNGFIQRLDTFRKYSFGVHGVYGDEPNLDIKGCWLWRGTEIPFEMKDHVSYEYNHYSKLDHTKEADRALVEEFWCNQVEDESAVEGQTVRTFKYYK